ncbi:DUF6261 family protein [Saccharicrinis fermentans]|uniref:Uncharacterized protein n=1 Tax=Saccharicrinis fermentans DSM 9555 = JCM 21142 TaxID=869213 RepID=W7Y5S0_9BACT|nr:DUF6261 family protein [Saccharicrinis fermentans]GAF02943.1 hypothetical protein JCM21142_41593 [Saccharicrinis fermentans DSM 9555 = JCM 21142]
MTIENPYFYKYQDIDYLNFSKRLFPILEQLEVETLGLAKPMSTAQRAFYTIQKAIQTKKNTACNSTLINTDAIRSDAIVAIKNYLQACQKKIQPEWKAHSKFINEAIKKHHWYVESASMEEKTKRIKALLKDIQEIPQLSSAIQKLHMQTWFDELSEAQNKFELALRNNIENSPTQDNCACTDMRNSFELMFKFIELMQQIQPNPVYACVIRDINTLINEYNQKVQSGQASDHTHKALL